MSERTKVKPQRCILLADNKLASSLAYKMTPWNIDGATHPDDHDAVAVPTDLANWDDDVRKRVVEAMARAASETAEWEGWSRSEKNAAYAATRRALTAALAALADETREGT